LFTKKSAGIIVLNNHLSGQLDLHGIATEKEVNEIRKRTEEMASFPEKANLLTCTTNSALDLVGDLSSKFEFEKNA
jgi:hypothetical protein